MIVFRLCLREHCKDLSGRGAEKWGGRWNSKGTAMIYTSETRALCTAEIAVHTPLGLVPQGYQLVHIRIPPGTKIFDLSPQRLPEYWDTFPHADATQRLGDAFVSDNRHAVMRVPSAVVQGEFNYLINLQHADCNRIRIEKAEAFRFDERLFRK